MQILDAKFGDGFALLLHHDGFPLLGHADSRRVDVQDLGVDIGGDQPAYLALDGRAGQAWLGELLPDRVVGAEGIGELRNSGVVERESAVAQTRKRKLQLRGRQFVVRRHLMQEVRFVRHADGRERASRAFGGMVEGGRNRTARADPRGNDGAADPVLVVGSQFKSNPLPGLSIVYDTLAARVAVFAQQQDLESELHAIGVPQRVAGFALARRAGFVFDGADRADTSG